MSAWYNRYTMNERSRLMRSDKQRVRLLIKIILKECRGLFVIMLAFQPLYWRIFGLVDWSWTAVIAVPVALLVIMTAWLVYQAVMTMLEYHRSGISFGDLLIRLDEMKHDGEK